MDDHLRTIANMQTSLCKAIQHIRDCQTETLLCPDDVDPIALPTLNQLLENANTAISAAFYTLAALSGSLRERR